MKAYRLIIAAMIVAALALQYRSANLDQSALERAVNFFCDYAVLANILAAVVLAFPAIAPQAPLGAWTRRLRVRAMTTLHMLIVALTHPVFHQAESGANVFLNYAAPLAMVIDWAIFTPRAVLPWTAALGWVRLPAAYIFFTWVRGLATDWFPYAFFDIGKLGDRAYLNFGIFLLAFPVIGLALIAVDRIFGLLPRDSAPARA